MVKCPYCGDSTLTFHEEFKEWVCIKKCCFWHSSNKPSEEDYISLPMLKEEQDKKFKEQINKSEDFVKQILDLVKESP